MKWRAANPSLSDGAGLCLCNVLEADRTGKVYPDGLDPDVNIEGPFELPKHGCSNNLKCRRTSTQDCSQY
jgi:hypothetical protein